jgi:hypothetical protein
VETGAAPSLRVGDVRESLLRQPPEGAHHVAGRSDIFVGAAAGTPQALMVARHEHEHMSLNAHTIYGCLLQQTAVEARRDGDTAGLERLRELLDVARTTHETAATAMGAWGVAMNADRLLEPYPDYRVYMEHARVIAKGVEEGTVAAGVLVQQACRVAMGAPLQWLFPNRSRWGSVPLADLPEGFRPDARLHLLLELAADASSLFNPHGWGQTPLTAGAPPGRHDEFHRWFIGQSEYAFDALASLLFRSCGLPTTTFNGHQWAMFTPPPGLSWSDDGLYRTRYHLTRHKPKLLVDGLADAGELDELDHGLLIVRPLTRILEQYELDEASCAALAAAAERGFVTGLRFRRRIRAAMLVRLVVLDDPQQIASLHDAGLRMSSSVCASAVADPDWWERWVTAINERTGFTSLLDIDPERWTESFAPIARDAGRAYESTAVRFRRSDGSAVGAAVLRIHHDQGSSPNPGYLMIAVAPDETASWLAQYWDETFAQLLARAEPEGAPGWLAAILGALADEEPWFDFDAAATG